MMDADSLPKRFYDKVTLAEGEGGWLIMLDGRAAKTGGKRRLVIPYRDLAEAIAAEWQAQKEEINLQLMPFTRRRMVVIDRADTDREKWTELILSYLSSDLLCYRAERPDDLVQRQESTWFDYLGWISDRHDIHLQVTAGIMAVQQPPDAAKTARSLLHTANQDEISCLAAAAEISGSAVLALALWQRFRTPEDIFSASRLDETYQSEKWGIDSEAAEKERLLRQDFLQIARYLSLVRAD